MTKLPIPAVFTLIKLDMGALGAAAKLGTKNNESDLTTFCEDAFVELLNLTYNLNLENANHEKPQMAGYDLVDKDKATYIQVTNTDNINGKQRHTKKIMREKKLDNYTIYVLFISEFNSLVNDEKHNKVDGVKPLSIMDVYRDLYNKRTEPEVADKLQSIEEKLAHYISQYRETETMKYEERQQPPHINEDSPIFKRISEHNSQADKNERQSEEQLHTLLTNMNEFQDIWWEQPEKTREVVSKLYKHSKREENGLSFSTKTIRKVAEGYGNAETVKLYICHTIEEAGITNFCGDDNIWEVDSMIFHFTDNETDEPYEYVLYRLLDVFTQNSVANFIETCDFEQLCDTES